MADSTPTAGPPPSSSPGPPTITLPPPYGEVDPSTLPLEYLQPGIIACAVLTFVAAAAFVTARFYTRWFIRRILGWEDWTILLALVFSAATSAGMIEQACHGLGSHMWQLGETQKIPLSRAGWYTILWYILSLACTKVSILLLYLRILTFDWLRNATYGLLAIVVIVSLFAFACALTACVPIQAWWDPTSYPEAVCHPQIWWWANTGMHLGTDFLIFLLPLPVIFTLRIGWRQRLLLYSIFTFGFFVCLISVIRLWILISAAEDWDVSYALTRISYWSCVEINFAIICACQMTLKPLLSRLFPTLFADLANGNGEQRMQQHAVMSIGGRPFHFGGTGGGASGANPPNSKSVRGPTVGAGGVGRSKRLSWVVGGSALVGNPRVDSDARMIEEDDAITLADLESGGPRTTGFTEPSTSAQLPHAEARRGASLSSEGASEMGLEARAESFKDIDKV